MATMLEKLRFQELIEETVTVHRLTRVMTAYQFVLAMVLSCYVGFSRLYHLRFLEREPMLIGILRVVRLPPQCTFWRFLASLHLTVAGQLLKVQRVMRQRVWEAAHVKLTTVTLDTDTTVPTLFGHQMGPRKGYNPKHREKKSFQPILTFLAETREYIGGNCATVTARPGDRLHATWRVCLLPCRLECRPSTRASTLVSTVGRQCKHMSPKDANLSSRRARRRG